jgi:acyl carrier protein
MATRRIALGVEGPKGALTSHLAAESPRCQNAAPGHQEVRVSSEPHRERLRALLRAELGHDVDELDGQLAAHFDSVDLMALVMAVEEEFGIVIESEDEEFIETLDDLLIVIGEKSGA